MGCSTEAGGGGGMAPRLTLSGEAGAAAMKDLRIALERSPGDHPPTAAGRCRHHVRRIAAVVAASLVSSGCMTGHLVDRARRWERPIAYERAAIADGRLTIAYTAAETNQFWRRLATHRRTAAVPLAQFADERLTVDDVRVERLPDDAPVAGTPTPLRLTQDGGRPDRLLVLDADGSAFLHPAVLTEERIAPWVYPLLPFAVVYDAVAVPVLLVFAPAVIVPGD